MRMLNQPPTSKPFDYFIATYKSLKGSCANSRVSVMTIVLQNGQWNLGVISHMTQETNQPQAFHTHSMVNVVDLLSR